MIRFPTGVEEAQAAARSGADTAAAVGPTTPAAPQRTTEYRAGGTDWQERAELGLVADDVIDLRDVPGLDRIEANAAGTRLGARVTIAQIAADPLVRARYPALARTAAALASPQIRAAGTLAGNLLQHARCWYYRSPEFGCHRSGVDRCPARDGDHTFASCFDLGPCIAPHPSTVGLGLSTYEATIVLASGRTLPVAELFGDGSDPRRGDTLEAHELVVAVELPPPLTGERAAYVRVAARRAVEWPLVDVVVRLAVDAGRRIRFARVAVGGVANIPLRLPHVEDWLLGAELDEERRGAAGELALRGAGPLPLTSYKLRLIPAAVSDALAQALEDA